jgi:ring-1,2-phenylacetyl-CoA epoxidase subunit PaaE
MSIHFVSLPITKIQDETPDAYTLFFPKPDDEKFNYLPGQYLTFRVTVNGEELRRAFSLSSSPTSDDFLSVTIKRVEGGRVSNYLRDKLSVGDTLDVLPPMGNFKAELNPANSKNYVLIGAGSGITPLMSIAKSVLEVEPQSVVTLWYGNRTEDSVIFANQLEALQAKYNGRLYVHHTLSKPSASWTGAAGRLDKDKIYKLTSDLFMSDEHRKEYYLCGPTGLIEEAEAALEKHAVNFADVHREFYSAPAPSEDDVAKAYGLDEAAAEEVDQTVRTRTVKIVLDDEEGEFVVEPSNTILEAAINNDFDPPYACQSGICTTCRCKLRSGVVTMDISEGLSDEELEEGYVLACQAHPLTDNVVLDFDE